MKNPPRPQHPPKLKPRASATPGVFHRPLHIAVFGAAGRLTPRLVGDLLQMNGARRLKLALCDADEARLQSMAKVVKRLLAAHGADQWSVSTSSRADEVLPGANYVIDFGDPGPAECVRFEYEIPLKYGVDQCAANIFGPGGLFRALRTLPAWMDLLAQAERLCPDAMVMTYAQPMSMLCLAAAQGSRLPVAGLCPSVSNTAALLARRAGVRVEDLAWECAGINHLAWFTKLEHRGKSLLPALADKASADLAGKPSDASDAGDLVRKDLLARFGAFPTGSSGHAGDGTPYYRKRKDLVARFAGKGIDGESGFLARGFDDAKKRADEERVRLLADDAALKMKRSGDYTATIIEACERDVPARVHATVPNTVLGSYSLVSNLPAAGVVEVACRVDRTGVRPIRYGDLPKPLAALCDEALNMMILGVRAATLRSREAAIQALMFDPLTAAACTTSEIRDLALELFAAEKAHLGGYR